MKDVSFQFQDSPEEGEAPAPPGPASCSTEKKPFALLDVNLRLKRGEKVAIVGRIGSGKTTLLNLVAGILVPDSGTIRVNRHPVADLEKRSFRRKIGFIQQEPVVFSETVAANIDFWRNCEPAWIEECARLAQLDGEIRSFPNRYQEKIGQRGVTLSGGQRQRLSIARALAGKPELLLMDDITSSLDAENERLLWNDLKTAMPGITCLIVTHRLSSAQHADRVVVLEGGRIAAIGTHVDLLKTSSTYQELVHA